jgi:hypothetical protein
VSHWDTVAALWVDGEEPAESLVEACALLRVFLFDGEEIMGQSFGWVAVAGSWGLLVYTEEWLQWAKDVAGWVGGTFATPTTSLIGLVAAMFGLRRSGGVYTSGMWMCLLARGLEYLTSIWPWYLVFYYTAASM